MGTNHSESDNEIIEQCPKERLKWLHSNFEQEIKSFCGLSAGNTELIVACCPDNLNATANDASLAIMEAIRVYFQTGEMPK